jgi:hypothetical protein
VRNNQSLAHDNPILNYEESLLILNHVTSDQVRSIARGANQEDSAPARRSWRRPAILVPLIGAGRAARWSGSFGSIDGIAATGATGTGSGSGAPCPGGSSAGGGHLNRMPRLPEARPLPAQHGCYRGQLRQRERTVARGPSRICVILGSSPTALRGYYVRQLAEQRRRPRGAR